jgi:putative ABC transport system permease protein
VSLLRQVAAGLRRLLRPRDAERDVRDEVAHYLEQSGGAAVQRTPMEEELRSYGWENLVSGLLADLRYALRRLRGSPGFTAVAVITLSLGIGAATAIFSVANPILFESLPYPHPGRLLMVSDVSQNGGPLDVTFGTFLEVSARARSFSALAVADGWRPALSGLSEPVRLEGERVSADFFRTLGVAPMAGRDFNAADDVPGGARVAIVSARLVRRSFGGDSAIVGRQIQLGGDLFTVIGVMPRNFENVLSSATDVWAPRQYRPSAGFQSAEWGHHMLMIGRLRAGVTADAARREVAGIARTPFAAYPRAPWASLSQGMLVHALQDDVTLSVRPALVAMIGAVLVVLAIVCVNVTNLLLARGGQRREEFAMRIALGAARGRLVRQLLTESLVLAGLGGALGLLVARAGVRALIALSPADVPRVDSIRVDAPVFFFALVITTLIGVAVGLVPAIAASREAPNQGLQGARRSTGRRAATSGALVVAEMALAVMLLVGAGLLVRSLQRLLAVAPGFESSHVMTMQIQEAGHRYDPDTARARFYDAALAAVRQVPGVTMAAFTSQLPLSGDFEKYGYEFASISNRDPNGDGAAFRYAVSPDYFRSMRIPLRRGRLLDEHDRPGAPEAIVVSESFARHWFSNTDPVGQQVRFGPEVGDAQRPWDVIVGVVGDVRQGSLALGDADAFYVISPQWVWVDNVQTLVVRTTGDAPALAPSIRRAIWSVDRDQPIVRVAAMDAIVATSEAQRRFAMVVFEFFALVALVLAAAGIYGVLSGRVTERTREIGVRSALGASRGRILGLIFGQGMALTSVGALIGVAGAIAASRALETLLFGITRLDIVTHVEVIAVLLGVSALACSIPAWRAARVDPAITLRSE